VCANIVCIRMLWFRCHYLQRLTIAFVCDIIDVCCIRTVEMCELLHQNVVDVMLMCDVVHRVCELKIVFQL